MFCKLLLLARAAVGLDQKKQFPQYHCRLVIASCFKLLCCLQVKICKMPYDSISRCKACIQLEMMISSEFFIAAA